MDLTPASRAELKALDEMEREGHWPVAGHEVRVTNLGKVLFPAEGDHAALTKRDLMRYYVTIGPTLVPHLAGRGLNLQRFPDGIGQGGLLAEGRAGPRAEVGQPLELHRARGREGLRGGRPGGHPRLAGAGGGDRAAPLDVAHHLAARAHLRADRRRPGDKTTFEEVLALARLYRTALEHLGVIGLPKTTGKRGVQMWVPVEPGYPSSRRATGWSSCRW